MAGKAEVQGKLEEEKIDFFLGDEEETTKPETIMAGKAEVQGKLEEEKIDFFLGDEEETPKPETIMAGKAEVQEKLEEEKIDFFLGDEEETTKPETAGEKRTEEEFIETITENDFLTEEENINFKAAEIAPALAEATDEGAGDERAALAETDRQPAEELEDNLELFFGEEEEPPAQAAAARAGSSSMEAITEDDFLTEEESVTAETAEITPALAEATDEGAGDERAALAEIDQQPTEELEEKLEFFFGEEKEPLKPTTAEPEEHLETIEDYQSLLKRMRVEFAERENALKQEIESLRQMIQSQ
ncbi:MAG TPA: hypothetical protein ENG79_07255 [Desulfobacteraceae bacterium]|nr:hypothetical protein [Desulfobacteraceae bacterium]